MNDLTKEQNKNIRKINRKMKKTENVFTNQINNMKDLISRLNNGSASKILFLNEMSNCLKIANNATIEIIVLSQEKHEIENNINKK